MNRNRIERIERAARQVSPPQTVQSARPRMPDIVEFVTSPEYLNLTLLPNQLLILKLAFLSPHLLTARDREVLERWCDGFALPDDTTRPLRYQGTAGTQPDVLDRVHRCRADGRLWMRSVVAVIGRRGSKGWLCAIAIAYILYYMITQIEVSETFVVDARKRVYVIVCAATKQQAIENQFTDIVDRIVDAPCFAPYRCTPTRDQLLLFSHTQVATGRTNKRDAAFAIIAAAATQNAVRGRACIGLVFDEAAHMIASGANRSAEEVMTAAKPTLATFGKYAFVWEGSSPWERTGQFYVDYQHSLEIDPDTRDAIFYDMLMLQFPSWVPYEDFELTLDGTLEMVPGGPAFEPLKASPLTPNDQSLVREQRADPDKYRIEYEAHWGTTGDAYLREVDIDLLFAPYRGEALEVQTHGAALNIAYYGHADPAVTNDRFAFVIAHLDPAGGIEDPHVIFDVIDNLGARRVLRPADRLRPRHCAQRLGSWSERSARA